MKTKKLIIFSCFALVGMLLAGCVGTTSQSQSSSKKSESSSEPSSSSTKSDQSSSSIAPEPTKLGKVVLNKIDETSVSWSAINDAVGYNLDVNGVVVLVTSTRFEVSEYGNYTIKVQAVADGVTHLNGDYSDPVTLNYVDPRVELDAPTVAKEDYRSIYWLPVENSDGYAIYDGETLLDTVDDETFDYAIDPEDYGLYSLSVVSLAEEGSLLFKDSKHSSSIVLELIDPATYKDRLSLEIKGNDKLFVGDSAKYSIALADKQQADISYIDKSSQFEITSGDSFATLDTNELTGVGEGEVTLKATLDVEPEITNTLKVNILEKPVLGISIASYDTKAENKISLSTAYAGKLYYLQSDVEVSKEEIVSSAKTKSVEVVAGDQEVAIELPDARGETVDVYFVQECKINDEVVGYSAVKGVVGIPLTLTPVHVTNGVELAAKLASNEAYIILDNDIVYNGEWSQIEYFNGILDGDGHKLSKVTLNGANGSTGLFKKLGNKAIIKNMTFEEILGSNFKTESNAVLASTVDSTATIKISNCAFVDCNLNHNVEGSSRSTMGCLFAIYEHEDLDTLHISVSDTFIRTRLESPREKETSNIGTIFGKVYSSSTNAITLTNCMIDAFVSGNYNNAAGLIGIGSGGFSFTNCVMHLEHVDGPAVTSEKFKADLGNTHGSAITTWFESKVIYTSYSKSPLRMGGTSYDGFEAIPSELIDDLITACDKFSLDSGAIKFTANGVKYGLSKETSQKLPTPILTNVEEVVSWEKITGAKGYEIVVDEEEPVVTTNCTYSIPNPVPGQTYNVSVKALGNGYTLTDSDAAEKEVKISDLPQLNAPVLTLTEKTVSWEAVDNAVGYDVYINNKKVSTAQSTTSYTIEVPDSTYGEWRVEVVAVGDHSSYNDSPLSNMVAFAVKYDVSTYAEMSAAIQDNIGYINITNNIDCTGAGKLDVTFTGILDGNEHSFSNLSIDKNNLALINQLGDGAIIRNIDFGTVAIKANTKYTSTIASKIENGAQVTLDNLALVVDETYNYDSAGGSGALFAATTEEKAGNAIINVNRVYCKYTYTLPAKDKTEKDVDGIGAITGKFSGTLNVTNSYFDVKFENASTGSTPKGCKASNFGGLVGYPQASTLQFKDTYLKYNDIVSGVGENCKFSNTHFDVGYQKTTTGDFDHVVVINSSSHGSESSCLYNEETCFIGTALQEGVAEKLTGLWQHEANTAKLIVCGVSYSL